MLFACVLLYVLWSSMSAVASGCRREANRLCFEVEEAALDCPPRQAWCKNLTEEESSFPALPAFHAVFPVLCLPPAASRSPKLARPNQRVARYCYTVAADQAPRQRKISMWPEDTQPMFASFAARQGSNSRRLRRLNERAVLAAVRGHSGVSKADLARMLGLTPPAVSTIVDRLINAGYLEVQSTRTGGVGLPPKLYGLRARGAFSVGLHIGRREMNCVLVDFLGNVLGSHDLEYDYPSFEAVSRLGLENVGRLVNRLPPADQGRVVGLGISKPHMFNFWGRELNYPPELSEEWERNDITSYMRETSRFSVFEENDSSAAALAELDYGLGRDIKNFFYIHINTFVGGGLVVGGRLMRGPQGMAASFGQHPVTQSRLSSVSPPSRDFEYLFRRASLFVLVRHLNENGVHFDRGMELERVDPRRDQLVAEWQADAVEALTQAIIGTVSIIDVEAIVIDGMLPRHLIESLVIDVQTNVESHNSEVVILPRILAGQVGPSATTLGAALLPMQERFWLSDVPLGVA